MLIKLIDKDGNRKDTLNLNKLEHYVPVETDSFRLVKRGSTDAIQRGLYSTEQMGNILPCLLYTSPSPRDS